jgi:uncharacterized protein (TIGR03083 family)
MEPEAIWTAIEAQRRSLADLLAGLAPSEWTVHSLCAGWTVKDVAAHLTLSTVGIREAVPALLRARGKFDTMIHQTAVAKAEECTTEQLVAELREIATSRRHPPGTRPIDPLVDVLVHGQDIARPLGQDRPIPTDAAVAAATRVWQKTLPHAARKRFAGVRFEATDAPVALGEGTPTTGPIAAILLVISGRATGLADLSGPGAALASRALAG